MAAMTKLEKACEDKGLKMTEQRRVIARVIADAEDHPDVETVYRRATAVDPRISIATVYRSLKLFEDANVLVRHDFGEGRARYEETGDAGLIWEGHKAGRDIGYCHLEKLHNLEVLPASGFEVSCFPCKIRGASAGWTRAVAIING